MSEELEKKLSVDRRTLKELLGELKQWSAPATVLLSLYVPPGRPISDVTQMLREELSLADNIKLKRTRNAVKRAISATIDRLSMIPKVPQNGLVTFCGEDLDTGDFKCYVFSPPEKVPVFYYRTDKRFITEILENMLDTEDSVGIIIIERDQATIGLVKGSKIEVLDELEDFIPGKHMMGGQSQRRFDRIIEQMVDDFMKKVAQRANELLLPIHDTGKLKSVVVAGPGYAKSDFVKSGYLDYRLQKILDPHLIDVSYQGEEGLREVISKAQDVIQLSLYREVMNAFELFKAHLAKGTGLVIYGPDDVTKAIDMGALSTLLIHEARPDVESWKEKAEASGAKVYIIPESLPESEWFLKTFDGLAGLLRYKVDLSSI
ncbi:MAG: peptide chain release factor aRF-1 [Acidilobus sp.]